MSDNIELEIQLKRQINFTNDAIDIARSFEGWLTFIEDTLEHRTPPWFIRWLFHMPDVPERTSRDTLEVWILTGEARIAEMEHALKDGGR